MQEKVKQNSLDSSFLRKDLLTQENALTSDYVSFDLRIAEKRGDIIRCQYFIAEIYNKRYNIFFSNEKYDLNAKVEPYPDYYIMACVDSKIVGCVGMYLKNTYIKKYGNVSNEDIDKIIKEANLSEFYSSEYVREVTKLVIDPKFSKTGLGALLIQAAYSKFFLNQGDQTAAYAVVFCGTLSSVKLHEPAQVSTRRIREFPFYSVHDKYRSSKDPMESHIVFPKQDIPKEVRDIAIPGTFVLPMIKRKGLGV